MTYIHTGDSMKSAFEKEINSLPHENWSPKERPEWLILEIEMDIMIRPIQIKVANHMMNPKDNKNSVMQLNMGEGKTALIIPMLLAAMANGKYLVRVVVLRSLFNINYSSLVQKMGGILNQRIYSFPCKRDINFDIKNVKILKKLYKECKSMKGIILTLPEHMLSFQLKGIEMCRLENKDLGQKLIDLEKWIDDNARDILDESDEILSFKYQLVYSVGKQSAISGGALRWQISQAVLILAREYFDYIKEKYGDDAVELLKNTEYPMAFPYFRLLNRDPYPELCELICTDILKGKSTEICFLELTSSEIDFVKPYILSSSICEDCRTKVKKIFLDNNIRFMIVKILRGLFAYDVFYNVISKRWRVDYGINPKRSKILQAVPYRAKDVPAERAQYEHPDVVIFLTQLSYYYSGLSDLQLDAVFNDLCNQPANNEEYERWIKILIKYCNVDESIKEYSGINLSDYIQKTKILFPKMRMHPFVINYWLNLFLYPKEAKQFTLKLSKSAWDICREKNHPMTGFSGTNDSKILLPLNAKYFSIKELKHTNGTLISHLLLKENNRYDTLKPDCTGFDIIEEIAGCEKVKLLLDVGALMLNLDNESVAKRWLKSRTDMEAAVFFKDNDLVVINRKGQITEFEMSTYRRYLDACVIYLDDCHTRGTDLKIPTGTVGAVTLGRGVTKDKLMQACMRMRMLGNGHSIRFYSSHEVHNQIIKYKQQDETIGSLEVIKWAIDNTANHIVEGFMYWATQGILYYRRESIRKAFAINNNYKKYSEDSSDILKLDIDSLYDKDRTSQYIKDIINNKIQDLLKRIPDKKYHKDFLDNSLQIEKKIRKFVDTVEKFSQLHDEEQEVELEQEQEQEIEKEKPREQEATKPRINQHVTEFVAKGIFNNQAEAFVRLPLSLKNSSLSSIVQKEAWDNNLFTTNDFVNTVSTRIISGDNFLRPPRWIAKQNINDLKIVILSGFEANALRFNFSKLNTSLMMLMPKVKQDQERIFYLDDSRISQGLLEQLSLFNGCKYFDKFEEQEEYLNFIGYCPKPRSAHQQEYFDRELIQKHGFVPRVNRDNVFQENDRFGLHSKFEDDPADLIIKLAEIRSYGVVSKYAHHLMILRNGIKPIKNKEDSQLEKDKYE